MSHSQPSSLHTKELAVVALWKSNHRSPRATDSVVEESNRLVKRTPTPTKPVLQSLLGTGNVGLSVESDGTVPTESERLSPIDSFFKRGSLDTPKESQAEKPPA